MELTKSLLMTLLVTLTLFFCSCLATSSTLKCYDCDTEENGGCGVNHWDRRHPIIECETKAKDKDITKLACVSRMYIKQGRLIIVFFRPLVDKRWLVLRVASENVRVS